MKTEVARLEDEKNYIVKVLCQVLPYDDDIVQDIIMRWDIKIKALQT